MGDDSQEEDDEKGWCIICGSMCCGTNPDTGQCNGAYEGLCHLAWEQGFGVPKNVDDIGLALREMAMAKKRAMQLRIRLTTMEGVPGHPAGIAQAFPKIKKMLSDGARGGVFDFDLNEGHHGDREMVVIDFDVIPSEAYDGVEGD